MAYAVASAASSRLDDHLLEAWTRALVSGDVSSLKPVFAAQRAQGPEVIWSPTREQLGPPQLRFLLDYWTERAAGRPAPEVNDVDPLEMRPALGFIVLADVIDGGRDFRIRLYGSAVSAVAGFDLTGKLVAEHPASPYLVSFYCAAYRAACLRREPVFTMHKPPPSVHTHSWHRLNLPLTDEKGEVIRFLSGNVPLNSAGQPVLLRL